MKYFSKKRGFTLIELLLVVAIIVVLASLVLVSVSKSRQSARDGKRKADLSTIQLALEMYKDSKGAYPVHATWVYDGHAQWATLSTELKSYLYPMPKDPINSTKYRYEIYTTNASYYIRTRVEDVSNKNAGVSCYYVIGGTADTYLHSDDADTFCD
ncbi:MAG: type II secretion system protein [Patescibacteria group bacterium]